MNKLNQNILILILIIVIIIIVIIIGFFSFSLIEINPEPEISMENLNMIDEELLDIRDTNPESQEARRQERQTQTELYELAVLDNNQQSCAKISEASIKDLCYNKIAINTLNIALCNYMNSEIGTKRCLLEVSLVKGAQEKSIKSCDDLLSPDLKTRCINQLKENDFCLKEDCL